MSTSLLPGAIDRRADQRPTGARPTALDHVHDHVLRLLGDPGAAYRVTTDVAARAADRAASDPAARSLQQLLRSAHARMTTTQRSDTLPAALVDHLTGDVDGGPEVVGALAGLPTERAALLDLTTRRGLDVATAASILDLDRRAAADVLEETTAAVRVAIAERGGGLHLEVRRVLRQLPLVPAPADCADRLASPGSAGRRRPVRPWLAWITTGVITLATFGVVASTLARAAEPAPVDAPVATAVAVDSGPAARQLAVPDTDRAPAEELLVRPSTSGDDEAADVVQEPASEPQPAPSPSADTGAPAPEPEPSPTTTAPPDDEPTAPEQPSDEPSPSPSPSEPPLDILPTP